MTARRSFGRTPRPIGQGSYGPSLRPTETQPISPAERTMLESFDAQRRLSLLRLIVPGLTLVAAAALPFAIYADLAARTYTSSLQLCVGLVGFIVSLVGIRARRVNLASYALFAGVAGVIVLLLLYDGPIAGALDVKAIPAFALLALPIVLAGLLTTTRFVLTWLAAAALFTVATIMFTPPTPALAAALSAPDGLVLYTVPVATQVAIGVLMLAATRGYRHIQRELGDIRVAYARERELDRLKDQFISSVNHELRTPIMAVQGYIELARELGLRGDTAQQSRMLERGAQATAHLAGLVRSVLDIRRVESDTANMRLAPVHVRPVAVAALRLLDPRAGQGQERELRLDVPNDLVVTADEERLRQVLLNLLSNAVKYSEAGTPIEIRARRAPSQPARRSKAAREADVVEIRVRDYGLGVPPDAAVLLFQRFVRLERDIASPVTGTGLGLAICRAYVEAMGGRIWVESTGIPGEGATFVLTLAMARPEPVRVGPKAAPEARR